MKQHPKQVQIIKDRFYWVSDVNPPAAIPKAVYFCIDNDLVYQPFYKDFGPLNLANTWKYVTQLEKQLASVNNLRIYHYTNVAFDKAANSAYLVGAYQVIVLGYAAEKAFQPFSNIAFRPFRDAICGQCTYSCTILDCLRGLEYAIKLGWFDYKRFDAVEYQHYERVQNGDLNWIVPGKMIAFSSPHDKTTDKYGNRLFTPADYVPLFKKMGVTAVVRLNNATYDAQGFVKEGINHHELFFTDGTAPSEAIVDKFLNIAEEEHGAIAIHCKAGLGRTGTLIGCYSMKHYRFPAAAFIGWIRIVRPGSILGPQQQYMLQVEEFMKQKGVNSSIWAATASLLEQNSALSKMSEVSLSESKEKIKKKQESSSTVEPLTPQSATYQHQALLAELSENDRLIQSQGDIGQGESLVAAKQRREGKNNQKQSNSITKQKQKSRL